MCKRPKYLFKKKKIEISNEYLICVPIVNRKKEIIDFQYSRVIKQQKDNSIFLLAGGKGTRLLPLTKNS